MGYEVYVEGKIVFNDIKKFKEEFEKVAQRRESEVGMHGDFDYFFTKIWGDNLEYLNCDDNEEIDFTREGKLWFDDEKAMELLSKFSTGIVKFYGEDERDWKFILDGKGNVEKHTRAPL